jgi:hypothetical protein
MIVEGYTACWRRHYRGGVGVVDIRNLEGLALEKLATQRLDLLVKREEMALTASRGKLNKQFQPRPAKRVCGHRLRLFSIAVGGRHGADAVSITHYRGGGNTRSSTASSRATEGEGLRNNED